MPNRPSKARVVTTLKKGRELKVQIGLAGSEDELYSRSKKGLLFKDILTRRLGVCLLCVLDGVDAGLQLITTSRAGGAEPFLAA